MYALILRKIQYKNNVYYQAIDKVIGKETSNNQIEIVEGSKKLHHYVSPIEDKGSRLVYFEISKEDYNEIVMNPSIILKDGEKGLEAVSNPIEHNEVILALHDEYHDFRLIPDYSIEMLIDDVQEDLHNKLLGQDLAVKKVLKKIYDNHMYYESDFVNETKRMFYKSLDL